MPNIINNKDHNSLHMNSPDTDRESVCFVIDLQGH